MHDPEEEEPRAALELRQQPFALMFAVLGATRDDEIAALAGYSARTVRRARAGQLGHVFIANTIHTLQQHRDQLAKYGLTPTLDDLFQVSGRPPESRAA